MLIIACERRRISGSSSPEIRLRSQALLISVCMTQNGMFGFRLPRVFVFVFFFCFIFFLSFTFGCYVQRFSMDFHTNIVDLQFYLAAQPRLTKLMFLATYETYIYLQKNISNPFQYVQKSRNTVEVVQNARHVEIEVFLWSRDQITCVSMDYE